MAMTRWCLYDDKSEVEPESTLSQDFGNDPVLTLVQRTMVLRAADSIMHNVNSPVHQAAPTGNTVTVLDNHSESLPPSGTDLPSSPPSPRDTSQKANDRYPRKLFEQLATTGLDSESITGELPPRITDSEQAHGTGTTKSTRSDGDQAPPSGLREELRTKNRIAASNSRKRKRERIGRLEQVVASAQDLHARLLSERLSLLQETSTLKGQLIRHAACHSPRIDIWIANEALRFVRELAGIASPTGSLSKSRNGI
ncbi:hypothetical protein E4U53_003331 [Claviceps sorghi]|nr:hypothetical protein E4U53_003331 [Claviceps sorghi]